MDAKNAKYWINFRAIRAGDDHYTVDSDEGTVASFKTHADALKYCEDSGESFHDSTE